MRKSKQLPDLVDVNRLRQDLVNEVLDAELGRFCELIALVMICHPETGHKESSWQPPASHPLVKMDAGLRR